MITLLNINIFLAKRERSGKSKKKENEKRKKMISNALKIGLESRSKVLTFDDEISSYTLNTELKETYLDMNTSPEYTKYRNSKTFLKSVFDLEEEQFYAITLYTFNGSKIPDIIDKVIQSGEQWKLRELSTLLMWVVSGIRKLPPIKTPNCFSLEWELEKTVSSNDNLFSDTCINVTLPFVRLVSIGATKGLDKEYCCYIQTQEQSFFIAYDTSNFTDDISAILDCGVVLSLRCQKYDTSAHNYLFSAIVRPQNRHLSYMTPQKVYGKLPSSINITGGRCFTLFGAAREFYDIYKQGIYTNTHINSLVTDHQLTDSWMKEYFMTREEVYALNYFLNGTFYNKKVFDLVNKNLLNYTQKIDSFVALIYSALERIGRSTVNKDDKFYLSVDANTYNNGYFETASFLRAFKDTRSLEYQEGYVELEVIFKTTERCLYEVKIDNESFYIFPPNTHFYTVVSSPVDGSPKSCIVKSAPVPRQCISTTRNNIAHGTLNSFVFKLKASPDSKLATDFRSALLAEKNMSTDTWTECLNDPIGDKHIYIYVHPNSTEDENKLLNSMYLHVRSRLVVPALCPRVTISKRNEIASTNNINNKWLNVISSTDIAATIDLFDSQQVPQDSVPIEPFLPVQDREIIGEFNKSGNVFILLNIIIKSITVLLL